MCYMCFMTALNGMGGLVWEIANYKFTLAGMEGWEELKESGGRANGRIQKKEKRKSYQG